MLPRRLKRLKFSPRHTQIRAVYGLIVVLPIAGLIINASLLAHFVNTDLPQQPLTPAKVYRVIAVGDIACDPDGANFNSGQGITNACQFAKVSEAVQRERADAVLLLGDIQYDTGSYDDFNKSFVPYWRNITTKIYAVPGNHDYGTGNIDGYLKAFSTYFPGSEVGTKEQPYQSFHLGRWQLYGLDSDCQYVGGCAGGSAQYSWLEKQLAASRAQCQIAFWHHPIFTSGIHRTADDVTRGRAFWDLLYQSRTDLVLNGHDHHYERFAPQKPDGTLSADGIREIIVGTGGMNTRPIFEPNAANQEKAIDDQFGYLFLTLKANSYDWQFKDTEGTVLDSGSATCH